MVRIARLRDYNLRNDQKKKFERAFIVTLSKSFFFYVDWRGDIKQRFCEQDQEIEKAKALPYNGNGGYFNKVACRYW